MSIEDLSMPSGATSIYQTHATNWIFDNEMFPKYPIIQQHTLLGINMQITSIDSRRL